MPLSSGMALLSSYGQMALHICANILVHKVTFTIIFVRTWWSEHRSSDWARHFLTLANCPRVHLCLGLVNKKRISSGSSHEWLWSVVNPTYVFDKIYWICKNHTTMSSSEQVSPRPNAQWRRHSCCIFYCKRQKVHRCPFDLSSDNKKCSHL